MILSEQDILHAGEQNNCVAPLLIGLGGTGPRHCRSFAKRTLRGLER